MSVAAIKHDYPAGTCVEFESFGEPDPYSKLRPGVRGHVTGVDDIGTVHVRWNDGSTLGVLVLYGDRIGKVDQAPADRRRPWRRCPACRSVCHWHDTAWVCDHCGDEWMPPPNGHGSQFEAPGGQQ